MKIYVVTTGLYSSYEIICATLDKEYAEKVAKKFEDKTYNSTQVEEYEDNKIMLSPLWWVRFDAKGELLVIEKQELNDYGYRYANTVFSSSIKGIEVCVLANTAEEAIKSAAEIRAQWLAEKAGL